MSDELKISERIWAKLHDHDGILDDDFECIAHDSEVIEKKAIELKEDRLKLLGIRLLLEIKEEEIEVLEKQVEEAKTNPKGFYYANSAKKMTKLEKQVEELQITDCHCSAEETTGWTTFRLCNICGKIQKK